MAATVTNDELSAQARLIWRASFLSSLLRSLAPCHLSLSLPLSLRPSTSVPPLFPRGLRPRSSPRSLLDLLPRFCQRYSGRTSAKPRVQTRAKHRHRYNQPTFLPVISMIEESSVGTLPFVPPSSIIDIRS